MWRPCCAWPASCTPSCRVGFSPPSAHGGLKPTLQAHPTLSASVADDRAAHLCRDGEHLGLFAGGHLPGLQRACKVLDERVELVVADQHPLVSRRHVAAAVDAGTAGALAEEVDEALRQLRMLATGEAAVDARIAGDVAD